MLPTRKYILTVTILIISMMSAFGQSGKAPYAFLSMPMSARMNALGGHNVSVDNGDVSSALYNPAILSEQTHMGLELNYAYCMSKINIASAIYSHNYKDNRFAVGVHYLDYGKMQYADEYGNLTGITFGARDMLIDLIYSRQLGSMFRVGASLKPIYSIYESYSSFSLGADVGAHFQTRDSTFQLGLSLQNIGWQLKEFYSGTNGGSRSMLPFNLELGFNVRFAHAPIRIGMTIHNIQRWNLGYEMSGKSTYVVGSKRGMTNDEWALAQEKGAVMWYDMMFRHTVFFIDIAPKSEKFYVTLSYNHRRRAELEVKDISSLAGLSIGAGINTKMVHLGFSFSQYAKGQYIYQTSLTLDINNLMH